jgi:hypothetical protein
MNTAFDFHSRLDAGEFFPADEQFLPGRRRENLSQPGRNRQKTQNLGGFRTFFSNRAEIMTVAQPLLGGK